MMPRVNILTLPLVVPEGWAPLVDADGLTALLVLVVFPLALALVIAGLVLLPRLVKGGSADGEAAWFGGPAKSGDDLAGPDGDDSKAGGASARW